MAENDSRPLILTARLDEITQSVFDTLRESYFPAQRNMVPAHLSLFNQLPAELLGRVRRDLEDICAEQAPFTARIAGVRFLGKGVAYTLDSPELETLHRKLAREWEPWLRPQDLQGLSAHVTVQNKTDPGSARSLYKRLDSSFAPTDIVIEGFSLWRYLGGPWEPVQVFRFNG